jgi:hypothetical protein
VEKCSDGFYADLKSHTCKKSKFNVYLAENPDAMLNFSGILAYALLLALGLILKTI